MFISKSLKADLDSKGVPAWFVHEIFSRDYYTDGMMLSWTFLPIVAQFPVLTKHNEIYGMRAAKQAKMFTDAAMLISLNCFKKVPGFKKLGAELETELNASWNWGVPRFFDKIRLKYDRSEMKGVIEASFWSSHDYEHKFGDWGYNIMNQAAHAARVFSEASKILGEEFAWAEAAKVLQEAIK